MRITSLTVEGYKPFKLGKIRRLTLSYIDIILVILAANGYGKSSLLREMTPLPANRSDYEADGLKRIGVHKDNVEYVLTSDFSNRTSPHSFIMDGVEKNTGGTTAVQLELIEQHLGYSQSIDDIVSGFHKFSTMQPGNRKTLLLTNNPFELGFILDKHKLASSQVRACQNNLTRLYERKTLLESEFLDKKLEEQLHQEETELKASLARLVEYEHRLGEQIRIIDGNRTHVSYDPNEVTEYLREVRRKSVQYHDVPRQGLETYLEQIKKSITEDEVLLTVLQGQIQQIVSELDKYNAHIADGSQKELIHDLKHQLDQLMQEKEDLSTRLIDNPFHETFLEGIELKIEQLIEILRPFVELTGEILAPRDLQKLRDRHSHYRQKLFEYRLPYERAQKELEMVELQIQSQRVPDPRCVSSTCALLLEYQRFNRELKTDQEKLSKQFSFYRHKFSRYTTLVSRLQEKIDAYDVYTPHLTAFSDFFRENSFLKIALTDVPTIPTLQHNPFLFVNKIQEHVQASKRVRRHTFLLGEIEKLTEKYLQAQKSDTVDRKFVQEIIGTKESELFHARSQFSQVETHLSEKRNLIIQILSYQNTLEKIDYYKKQGEAFIQDMIRKFDRDVYVDLRKQIDEEKVRVSMRLHEIGSILRNQETLQIRYQVEVVDQIKVLEFERHRMSLIEKALSPNSGIPHQYTISYLNALLKTMNHFIARVFSYPMELTLLKDDDPLTYKFPIVIDGDVTLTDVSMGSSAQKEMIDAAFMLAQIVQLKLSDYALKVDELDRAFDSYHRQRLLELLSSLVDEGIISQLFLVSHHAVMSQGLSNADNLVLNEANITLPAVYNTNVTIE